ncbi:MAG: L-aspartate oxidase [Lysinibacillus sp.]
MYKTDVLIIGSGIAALQAARMLGQHLHVHIITKSSVNTSSSYRAQGGIAAVTNTEDQTSFHIADTLSAGLHHHEKKHVAAMIEDGTKMMQAFVANGLPIDRQPSGEPSLGLEGAHSHHRILHAGGDQTGKVFIDYLLEQLPANVKIHPYEMAYDLLLNTDGECIGAIVKSKEGDKRYFAHHVILASGGAGALYSCTSNYATNTGDGIALAYRVGAAISDMEFMQFHPSLLFINGEAKGLVSEAVRGAGGIFVDEQKTPIMQGVHPLLDLAPRHITAHTLFTRLTNGQVTYIDITSIEHFEEKFPTVTKLCRENGVDLHKGLIPVVPGSHFLMGGIIADCHGKTSIPKLYAIGEVACTGVHGANRLASNSLLEGLVFGENMARFILDEGCVQQNFLVQPANKSQELPKLLSKQHLQHAMMDALGVIRHPSAMETLASYLPNLQGLQHVHLQDLPQEKVELYMMHTVAALMLQAALTRKESRGAHIRSDFPEMDTFWQQRWIIFKQGQMEVRNSLYEYHQTRGYAQAIF